jgi:DNA-binding NarL/FixJ family response regulator
MKFLVVDDHALIREAMCSLLSTLREHAQVLQASDGAQALAELTAHPDVDLVLLDLDLPDRDGLTVLDDIAVRHPGTGVVMLSGSRDADSIQQALRRGAQGFIPKAETRDVLTQALELVLAGGIYVPMAALGSTTPAAAAPSSAGGTSVPSASPPKGEDDRGNADTLGLTERQLAVLALLMQGLNNKLICRALGLAEPTVKNHVSAILRALGVTSRTEAVLAVSRLGLKLPSPSPRHAPTDPAALPEHRSG